jgi:SET and MYND domain-containing protein
MNMFNEDQFSYFHNHQVTRGSELEAAGESISTLLDLELNIELLRLIVDTFDRTNLTIEVESKSMLSDVAAGLLTEEVRGELLKRHHEEGFPILDESVPLPVVIGTGHYPTIALMNHSCDPNTEWRFTGGSASIEMIALKPIAVGEELRISYIDQTLSYEERQSKLQELYGFKCECPKCISDGSFSS